MLRRVLTWRPVERIVSTLLRARLLRPSLRFAWRELTGSTAVGRYRVASTGVVFHVRHGSPDVLVFDEIFYQRLYEPTPGVAAVLDELPPALRAVDLGGNIGLFGVWLVGRRPDASLVSIEPDRPNADLLRRTIDANATGGRWEAIEAAAATRQGPLRLAGGDYAVSHVLAEGEASGSETTLVPGVDAFEYIAEAQLVKIDIEGAEWDLLADPRLATSGVRVLALEYHPRNCPTADPHTAHAELLRGAGFTLEPIFQAPTGVGMTWGWR